ncbi:MAG: Gfo/Idh/MocA family oxidoreductase [Dehalococcoidales bacterium]|nr:Gfo/Idh/MocA family oxidoreductase [Dehalococcoidales bacterium]
MHKAGHENTNLPVAKTRVGIIGLGKMGLLHATILNTIPNVETAAICESKALLTHFARKALSNITVVEKVHDLKALGLDAVFVSTPIPSHHNIISALFAIGIKNIFTEKTLASSGEESRRICQLAPKGDGVNMVGYMARFAVTFRKAKELLESGTIGELISFKGYAYSSDFIGIPEKSYLRGGVLRDLGCHIIDLAMWYFGEFSLSDAKIEPREPVNGESSAEFQITGSKGITGHFDISWCREGYRIPDYGIIINGASGVIEVNNDCVKLDIDGKKQAWYRADLNDSVPFLVGAAEYYREDSAFINAVLGNNKASPDFFEAARVDGFIDEVKIKAGSA